MIKRLSCVLKLSDSFSGRPAVPADITILCDGVLVAYQYKAGGFFVLVDLEQGEHTLEIRSWKYRREQLDITVDYSVINAENAVRYVMLNPSVQHPMAASAASFCADIPEGEAVYVLREGFQLKIAEDNADEGKTLVRMFSDKSAALYPSMFLIRDKSAAKSEFVVIKGCDGDMYMFGSPLRYSHARSTPAIPLIRYIADRDGVFAMLPGGLPEKDGEVSFTLLLEKNGKLTEKQLCIPAKGTAQLGSL